MSRPPTKRVARGPVRAAERILAPDLARGLMLALIALANISFYLYGRPFGLRGHIVEDGLVDRLVALLTATLVDGRAYPLFAALFGYGMASIMDRQRAAGASEPAARALLRRRSCWLIVFGFLHALLLFSGDILGLYGVLGLVLVAMLGARDRTLLRVASWWLVVVAVVQGLALTSTGTSSERLYARSYALADPLAALVARLAEWPLAPFGTLGVVSAALVGVWAQRRRLFSAPEQHRLLLRRVAAGGLTIAVLGGLPVGLAVGRFWEPGSFLATFAISALHAVTGVAGGLGYAALIALVAARLEKRRGPLVLALAATGERSLTCYLLQSVLFVALLAPYTLGLGGQLGTATAALLALATWLATVVVADTLRRAGRRGPAELLLRRLTYGRAR